MPSPAPDPDRISRREAIQRVTALLGGVTLVGGSALLAACERERRPVAAGARVGEFTAEDVAFLDEVAETILPETATPGAKAARTGAFMALMVTDTYDAGDRAVFRDGMRALDEASRRTHGASFLSATPAQRLALLTSLDREAKAYTDAREAARRRRAEREAAVRRAGRDTVAGADTGTAEGRTADRYLPDQRQENAPTGDVGGAAAVTADAPPHYFRMMKELALLGYFTSEVGYTRALRYVEAPGRFDPCVPYARGEPSWAPHA